MRQADLFTVEHNETTTVLAEQAVILRGFALPVDALFIEQIHLISEQATFRNMLTPGGRAMSVAMTNCGEFGWFTDQHGYRYTQTDPSTGTNWPDMPDSFKNLAIAAASDAGFSNFRPDACLINRYQFDSRMGLHQDKDEQDLNAPIVSVSLGAAAEFLFGGFKRRDPTKTELLQHGDIVVWGGTDRLRYHGIRKIIPQPHPLTGPIRFNLTFRQVV